MKRVWWINEEWMGEISPYFISFDPNSESYGLKSEKSVTTF